VTTSLQKLLDRHFQLNNNLYKMELFLGTT